MIITSIWLILATILCVWFIITDRNYFNIPWVILICIIIYTFLPIILFMALVYFIFWVAGVIDRK